MSSEISSWEAKKDLIGNHTSAFGLSENVDERAFQKDILSSEMGKLLLVLSD